jgi:hypothetical protein
MRRYAPAIAVLLLFAGCGEKKEDEQQAQTVTQASGHIEVSKNADAYKQKIEKKSVDKKQSKSYYYDYNTDKKKSTEKKRTTIDANLHVRSPYEQVEIELMVHKLSKEFIVKCSACHNDYANGIIGPSLLGKDAKFIYGTIAKYKTGKKENVLMTALVKQMSDEEIEKLANEIAEFNTKINELRSKRGMK